MGSLHPLASALLICAFSSPVFAGEIIGNTYISEKDGVIEITAEGWDIKDAEGRGGPDPYLIVTLHIKGTGAATALQFWRLANPGGAVTPEAMLQELRKVYEKQGMEVGAMEPRRVSGKRVLTMSTSISKGSGRSNGFLYMMQGEKSLYWAQFWANVTIFDDAQKKFDEVIEKVRY